MNITLELTDTDLLVLAHDVPDVEAWVKEWVASEVARRRKRLDEQAKAAFDADPAMTSMPGSQEDRIALFVSLEGYKNAATRQEENDRGREAAIRIRGARP